MGWEAISQSPPLPDSRFRAILSPFMLSAGPANGCSAGSTTRGCRQIRATKTVRIRSFLEPVSEREQQSQRLAERHRPELNVEGELGQQDDDPGRNSSPIETIATPSLPEVACEGENEEKGGKWCQSQCHGVASKWMKMVLGGRTHEIALARDEVVEHWCIESACQSDPDIATDSQSVAPRVPREHVSDKGVSPDKGVRTH